MKFTQIHHACAAAGVSCFTTKPTLRAGVAASLTVAAIMTHLAVPIATAAEGEADRFRHVDLSSTFLAEWKHYRPSIEFYPPPEGIRTLNGVPFNLEGVVQFTGTQQAASGDFRLPNADYTVNQTFTVAHLLHHSEFRAQTGTPAARMIFHYEDGSDYEFILRYGVHFQDWYHLSRTRSIMGATTRYAWLIPHNLQVNNSRMTALWQTSVPNPAPEKRVRSIEFQSTFGIPSYTLDGLTLEAGEARPELVESPALTALEPNSTMERRFRLVDESSGEPVAGARFDAWLEVADGYSPWGSYETDAEGRGKLVFPAERDVDVLMLVVGPDHVPVWKNLSQIQEGDEEATILEMKRGKVVGGRVVDGEQRPVAEAEVRISGVMAGGPSGFVICEWPSARTDSDGRWRIGAAPDDFSGLTIQVSHPQYLPASYEQDDSGDPYVVSAVELLEQEALMELSPGLELAGVVQDDSGAPVVNATVTYYSGVTANAPAQTARTAGDGSFRLGMLLPGEGTLVATSPGMAPTVLRHELQGDGDRSSVELSRSRGLTVRFVSQDGSPVSDAYLLPVEWREGAWLRWLGQSDDTGLVSWPDAPEEPVRYLITGPDMEPRIATLAADGTVQTFHIDLPGRVALSVVDDDSGEPIDSFTVIKGTVHGANFVNWETHAPKPGYRGTFRLDTPAANPSFSPITRLKVTAPGYYPGFTPDFRGGTNFVVRLERGIPIEGRIVDEAGRPVSNAQIVPANDSTSAYMDKPGEFRNMGQTTIILRSGSDGAFSLPVEQDFMGVYTAHPEAGFGAVTSEALKVSGEIRLSPWARVEGVVDVGDQWEDGALLSLHRPLSRRVQVAGDMSARLSVYLTAQPGEDGSFLFEKAPPIELEVAVKYPTGQTGPFKWSHGVAVSPVAGETNAISIGGTGRSVVGRVAPVGFADGEVDFLRDHHSLESVPSVTPPSFPAGTSFSDQAAAAAAMERFREQQREFWESDDGRRHREESRTYVLRFSDDGSFHCHRVPPGKYRLNLTFTKPGAQEYIHETVAQVSREVVVPPGERAFDLGEIEVTKRGAVVQGARAPEMAMAGLDGKALHLDHFRGRHLVMHFWSPELPDHKATLDRLKEIHDSVSDDQALGILSLAVDVPAGEVAELARENGYDWTHVLLDSSANAESAGAYLSAPRPGASNSEPALLHLIGPDGRMIRSAAHWRDLQPAIDPIIKKQYTGSGR